MKRPIDAIELLRERFPGDLSCDQAWDLAHYITRLESELRALEWAGTGLEHAHSTWSKCPRCGAVEPAARDRYAHEVGDDQDYSWEKPGGLRHAPVCTLAELLGQCGEGVEVGGG